MTDAIDDITLGDPDFGGDGPENAIDALKIVADTADWRPGSNRFIFTFSDASAKGIDHTSQEAIDALNDKGITLVSLSFSGGSHLSSMTSIFDGEVPFEAFLSSATAESIVDDITAGITAGFADYDEVTVSDLGAGAPEIDVSVSCVSADIGSCVGADAVGDYDRSEARTFEFDVTFTRTAEGDKSFFTYALVDGGIVAREADSFGGSSTVIPLPAAGWLMIGGFGALAALRRRKKAA